MGFRSLQLPHCPSWDAESCCSHHLGFHILRVCAVTPAGRAAVYAGAVQVLTERASHDGRRAAKKAEGAALVRSQGTPCKIATPCFALSISLSYSNVSAGESQADSSTEVVCAQSQASLTSRVCWLPRILAQPSHSSSVSALSFASRYMSSFASADQCSRGVTYSPFHT